MSCYPHHWERIWQAFDDTRSIQVKILKTDLASLIECTGRPMPAGLVILSGVKLVTCHRPMLFDLLNRHGREPCHQVDDDQAARGHT